MKLLAFTKYGDQAASARQRYLQFKGHLRAASIDLQVAPLLDNSYLNATFSGGAASKTNLVASYWGRFRRLRQQRAFYGVWLQYEFFPYAPAFFETLALARDIPLIVDYDDAIFHQYNQHKSRLVRALLGGKLKPLLRRSDLAICGNSYLQAYAAEHCRRTEIVPTVVDTDVYRPPTGPRPVRPVIVGWIGSPSTWAFVKPVVPVLSELCERHGLRVRVVGAGPQADLPPYFEFLSWSETEEIRLLQEMDIGIMPLPDEPWARGKCGYKLIQYMACGLPVIASPVGVNSEIVQHGVDGFLASTQEEWGRAIRTLAESAAMRANMGALGRRKVERGYSLAVHGPRLAQMMRDVLEDVEGRRG